VDGSTLFYLGLASFVPRGNPIIMVIIPDSEYHWRMAMEQRCTWNDLRSAASTDLPTPGYV